MTVSHNQRLVPLCSLASKISLQTVHIARIIKAVIVSYFSRKMRVVESRLTIFLFTRGNERHMSCSKKFSNLHKEYYLQKTVSCELLVQFCSFEFFWMVHLQASSIIYKNCTFIAWLCNGYNLCKMIKFWCGGSS